MRQEGKRGRMERNLQTGSQVVDTSCHERYQCFFLNPSSDLDQLNHILNIVGSPSAEDLSCIMNDKVKTVLEAPPTIIESSSPSHHH